MALRTEGIRRISGGAGKGQQQKPPVLIGEQIAINGWTFTVIKVGMGAVVMKPTKGAKR